MRSRGHLGRLDKRAALVTGGSGGIGRAIAVALAAEGARVCVVGRDPTRLADTVNDIAAHGPCAVSLVADLTEDGRIEELIDLVGHRLGGLDVLVHAAGIYSRALLADAGVQELDALFHANLRVPFRITQAALPLLTARRGDIVFVNSTQGLSAGGSVSQYAATQHAVRGLADSLRTEVNGDGVRVTTLHVGRTATPLQAAIVAGENRAYEPQLLIHPEDIADLVVSAVTLPRRAQVTTLTIWPTRPP